MTKVEKILFVDDDPVCSFLNVTLVEQLEIAKEAKALSNAEKALAYIQKHYSGKAPLGSTCPDLIFLDIYMPVMDGFEFLQELDKLPDIDRSRFLIVMLTASLHPADKEKLLCRSEQVHTCLPKPLSEEDLEKLIEDMFTQSN